MADRWLFVHSASREGESLHRKRRALWSEIIYQIEAEWKDAFHSSRVEPRVWRIAMYLLVPVTFCKMLQGRIFLHCNIIII